MVIAFSKTKGNIKSLDFHSHEYYEIYVFHGGNCRYIIGNNIIDLVPGMILLMNGKHIHKAHVTKNIEDYERSVLHFTPDFIEQTICEFDCASLLEPFHSKAINIRQINYKEDLDKIATQIQDLDQLSSLKQTHLVKKEMKIGIMKLLMFIERKSKINSTSDENKELSKHYYVEQIVEYLQNNYYRKVIIDEIGHELNLSPSYLSRIFKETTGYTIMEYLMYYRFTQAKYQIEISSEKTFIEIASSCGFQSSAHFSRFIKSRTGMTPGVFKETIQRESYISPKVR